MRIACILLLLMVACGGSSPTDVLPTFDHSEYMQVKVLWLPADEITEICDTPGAGACAIPGEEDGLCVIYMPEWDGEYDLSVMRLLGHEFSHCIWGYWHD